MNKPLTLKSTDHSGKDQFGFSFYCDTCEKEWQSRQIPFEAGGFTSIEKEEAYQLLWAQEHRTAFEKANLEAHWHFNNCPKCGKWVCNDCFYFTGVICKKCAENFAKKQ